MPIVTLEFQVPEEQEEMNLALNGSKYYGILYDFSQWARTLGKYDEREQLPKEEVIKKIHELLEEFEGF